MESNITEEESHIQVVSDSPALLWTLLVCPALFTAMVLTAATRFIWQRTQISHPLYAVLFQDMVFLSAGAWITFLSLLLLQLPWLDVSISRAYIFMPACILFHQISWFVVTILKSRLILKQLALQQEC